MHYSLTHIGKDIYKSNDYLEQKETNGDGMKLK